MFSCHGAEGHRVRSPGSSVKEWPLDLIKDGKVAAQMEIGSQMFPAPPSTFWTSHGLAP